MSAEDAGGLASASSFRTLDRICDAFEQAWQTGDCPSIQKHLAKGGAPLRPRLLRELLLIDLEYRDRRGERPATNEYICQFPADAELVRKAFEVAGLGGESSDVGGGRSPEAQQTVQQRGRSSPSGELADDVNLLVRLQVVRGLHRGREFTFCRHENFIVGRASCAHFRLPRHDPYFSRAHFMVEVNPPRCRLVDLRSTNGTRVNGRRVNRAELHHGDLIQAGHTVMKVCIDTPAVDEDQVAAVTEAGLAVLSSEEGKQRYRADRNRASEKPEAAGHVEGLAAPTATVAPAPIPGVGELPQIRGYRILRLLGRGGMGLVYLARRQKDRMPVALKTIKPAVAASEREVRRFFREAEILRDLRHPRIVEFQEMGQASGLLYFVMDYVPGINGAEMVRQRGPLPIRLAVWIACQALEGLMYAHGQKIVHRDVKPSNLLISTEGSQTLCKLVDFGLARVYFNSRLSGLTLLGEIAGTAPYIPPEQITNFHEAGPASDQYSLSATLYYLLTGRHMFDFADLPPEDCLLKILFEDPRPIQAFRPEIPDSLAQAMNRALAKNPDDRFRDVGEFRESIVTSAQSTE